MTGGAVTGGVLTPRRLAFALLALSLLTLGPIAFHSKSPQVFYRFDGSYLLILAAMQKVWSLGSWNFTSNPLQGLGGLDLPWHSWLDPAMWLLARLAPSIAPTVAMVLYSAALALATCWLGVRMGLPALTTVTGAWTALLLAFPYVYPTLGFDFLWGVPAYVPLIVLDVVVFLLFLDLGRGPVRTDAVRLLSIAAMCAYQLVQYPNFVPVSFVVLTFFGAAGLVAAGTWRERVIKLVAAALLAGGALALFGELVIGLYGFAKPTYFWYEFFERPGRLRDVSFLVADHSRWPAWIVAALAMIGALQGAVAGGAAMRPIARTFLAFVGTDLILILLVNHGWKGPRIAYLDVFAYPFYCLFAAHAAALAVARLARGFAAGGGWLRSATVRAVAVSAVPWLVLLDYSPPPLERPLARNHNPYVWPPAETPVTRFLAREVALRPGAPFRGRVASVAGSAYEAAYVSAPLINQHNWDVMNLFFTGNDHRLSGLWYYGIPTLVELNQFSSPFFHLVNARLLNAPGTRDLRSYETQSIVNRRVMALLGARYLITDALLPNDEPVLHYRLVEGRDTYVYALAAANVAGYSVTRTRRASTAQEAIAGLADPAVDLRITAVLTGSTELPALVPAIRSRLVVERGAYRVEAESAGTSLLVLPIEYSHCLRMAPRRTDASPPRLLRANLALAAVLFTGRVDGQLQLRYGPLSSGCRMEDWREAAALKIGDARDWP
jgi:hypothetical protein